jgi:hypothetical protein
VAAGSKSSSKPVVVGSSATTSPRQKSLKDLQWKKQKPPKRPSEDEAQPPAKKPKVQKKGSAKRQLLASKKAGNAIEQPWWPEPTLAGDGMDMIDDDVKGGQWSWPQVLTSHPGDAFFVAALGRATTISVFLASPKAKPASLELHSKKACTGPRRLVSRCVHVHLCT